MLFVWSVYLLLLTHIRMAKKRPTVLSLLFSEMEKPVFLRPQSVFTRTMQHTSIKLVIYLQLNKK